MSSVTTTEGPATRMKADARRELVLEAATRVFGERGYFGATTDAVAREAGISQPYIVRMFGTKETLFVEVLQRGLGRLLTAFRGALAADGPGHPDGGAEVSHRIGQAYGAMLADRGLLLSLMHGFILGTEEPIGACVRAGFLAVWRFLRDEAGFTADAARDFLAGGMLLNTLMGLHMTKELDHDSAARELLECSFPTKLDFLRSLDAEDPAGI